MNLSEVLGVIAAFGLVVLCFSWLRLRITARPETDPATAAAEGASDTVEGAQGAFRDEMMARLRVRWAGELEMNASDPISFTLRTSAQREEEAMLIVLVNLYSGCLKHPEGEETFKEHFLEDLVSKMRTHLK